MLTTAANNPTMPRIAPVSSRGMTCSLNPTAGRHRMMYKPDAILHKSQCKNRFSSEGSPLHGQQLPQCNIKSD